MFRFVILLVALLASVSAFAPARFGRSQTALSAYSLNPNKNKAAPVKKAAPAPAPAKKAAPAPAAVKKAAPAPAPAKKAAPAPVKKAAPAPAKKAAPAAPTKPAAPAFISNGVVKKISGFKNPFVQKGVDYTWGGRPDPTPEIVPVSDSDSFFYAPWRYGK